ncbi:MAG: ATP phosphoribosyltransferase regulatory subunit, partial [Candidatus Berkelbacteria bacterium]|nr:ATP phosphoribosyltransferase regulatory subunit [Candidatus Berkelbacteria bacterium]
MPRKKQVRRGRPRTTKAQRGRPRAKRTKTVTRKPAQAKQMPIKSEAPKVIETPLIKQATPAIKIPRSPARRVKGMHDVLPKDQRYFETIKFVALKHFRLNGFERIDVPTIEYASLFSKGTGKDTDIVQKEMYYIAQTEEDEKEAMALRPEATPGIARAYVEHGML